MEVLPCLRLPKSRGGSNCRGISALRREVKITLSYQRSSRALDTGKSDIQLFFHLHGNGDSLSLETDEVIQDHALPNPANNVQRWKQVGQLLRRTVISPQQAFDEVAMEMLLRQLTFSFEDSNAGTPDAHFYIHRKGHEDITASTHSRNLVNFFTDGPQTRGDGR